MTTGHTIDLGSGKKLSKVIRDSQHRRIKRKHRTPQPKLTPSFGFFLYTLTAGITGGSGTATIRNMADDTEIETGATLNDPLGHMDGLASGKRGVCIKSDGEYYTLTPYVVDVRWDDPDLEQTKDGTNYDNIDTAEDC